MTTYSKTYMTNRAIYIEYGKLADNQLQSKHMNERITPVTSEYLEIVIRKKNKKHIYQDLNHSHQLLCSLTITCTQQWSMIHDV